MAREPALRFCTLLAMARVRSVTFAHDHALTMCSCVSQCVLVLAARFCDTSMVRATACIGARHAVLLPLVGCLLNTLDARNFRRVSRLHFRRRVARC